MTTPRHYWVNMIHSVALAAIVTLSALPEAISFDTGLANQTFPDMLRPLILPRSYQITCCLGGKPIPDVENKSLISDWTVVELGEYGYVDGHKHLDLESYGLQHGPCMRYEGRYNVSGAALLSERGLGINVKCDCPEIGMNLDRNCRHLPSCLNGGYRAFSINLRCACPEPYFGEVCEKFCDRGERIKNVEGKDYCSCLQFFQGEECRDITCLNGGTNVKGRCVCLPEYLGYHCENGGNRTNNRFDRYDHAAGELFSRDISGTIFSLIMIIVLVVSMYLLVKRRMQMQQRMMRREDNYRSRQEHAAQYGIAIEDAYITPFRSINTGPPPYMPQPIEGAAIASSRSMFPDDLPPLPSYEDATKQPPLSLRIGGQGDPLSPSNEQSSLSDERGSVSDIVESDAPSTSTPPTDGAGVVGGSPVGDDQSANRFPRTTTSRRSI